VQFRANGGGQPMTTRPQALRRVVTNLLDNALKFGDAAEVTLNFTPDEITLIVADNGPGIPPDELTAVLQPFYRVESSRNRETGGTGLGLAIAAQLTGHLGGKLLLANRDRGGLAVTLTLPASGL
jgi:signal transduction histidine kinase